MVVVMLLYVVHLFLILLLLRSQQIIIVCRTGIPDNVPDHTKGILDLEDPVVDLDLNSPHQILLVLLVDGALDLQALRTVLAHVIGAIRPHGHPCAP